MSNWLSTKLVEVNNFIYLFLLFSAHQFLVIVTTKYKTCVVEQAELTTCRLNLSSCQPQNSAAPTREALRQYTASTAGNWANVATAHISGRSNKSLRNTMTESREYEKYETAQQMNGTNSKHFGYCWVPWVPWDHWAPWAHEKNTKK